MAHFLLAWELGANLGHAARLRPVARALKARGHRVSFVLRDIVSTQELLGGDLGPAYPAPLPLNAAPVAAWSLADVLLACGYASVHTLGGLVAGWKALIEVTGCDALLADHAPTALLAARIAGIPALHLGHGFSIPPRQSPLPLFRDWATPPAAHAHKADAQAWISVNGVLAANGAAALPQLCDLFYPEKTLLCTWPELDHYAHSARNGCDYLGPDCEFLPGVPAVWPQGAEAAAPRVFAYLRAAYPGHAELLRALDERGCATLCFFPDRAASSETLPQSPRIHYSAQAVDMQQVLGRCDLLVCHAGQATVAQAMRAGVPCLLLPTQAEQFLLARRLAREGAALNAAEAPQPVNYAALIAELTRPDAGYAQAARALADKHARFDPALLTAHIAAQAEALLR